jgi:hypothetical protein
VLQEMQSYPASGPKGQDHSKFLRLSRNTLNHETGPG